MSSANANTPDHAIVGWLLSRDTGTSSECIVAHLLGFPHGGSYPVDPSDLGRCLRLLKLFPALAERIGEMASISKPWAALVARWDEIARSMDDEVGIAWQKGREAPKTYRLMKSILRPAEDAQGDIVLRFGRDA